MNFTSTRRASLNLSDVKKIKSHGSLLVAQSRLRSMAKWIWLIISAAIANPILYLISIGIGVGSFIDKSAGPAGIDGVKYLTFLAPALLAAAAIQGAMEETVYPTLEGFKWNRTFYAINSTPISGNQIAEGVFIAALIRVIFTVVIYWFVMLAFGALESSKAWLAIPTAIFAGAAFGALMQSMAAALEDENVFFTVFSRFILMPLFLFSGTFFPLSSMPIFLQWIGWISPLWHATELGRYLTYGHQISSLMFAIHFVFLTILLLSGLYMTRRLYTKRLAK